MRKTAFICGLLVLLMQAACSKDDGPGGDHVTSGIVLTKDAAAYGDAVSNRTPLGSDPFELTDVSVVDGTVSFTVSYSGGCKQHTFEVIWGEALKGGESPGIDLIIKHNAHGDPCEAYITETLSFPLNDLLDTLSLEGMTVLVLNGGNDSDSVTYETPGYDFGFTDSDDCTYSVTAQYVLCGTGLYGNLWFALDDSISAGAGYYYRKYLRPVATIQSLAAIEVVAGKKYKIGARKFTGDDPFDGPVCLAYPGPSVPIRIMCLQEEE